MHYAFKQSINYNEYIDGNSSLFHLCVFYDITVNK